MVNWTGLSQGIERGVRIAHSMDENERRNQEMDDRMQDRAQRRILTDMQIDQYKDQNKRQEDLRNMRMAKEGLVHLKGDNRETFLKSYNASPESFKGMDAGMDRAGQIYADMITEQQGDGLKRDFKRLIPLDGGKLAVEFTVTKPDGSTYEAPATINSSADPKDQVVALTLDDLGGYLSALEAEITSLDTQMVGLGDTSAIDKREQAVARAQDIEDKKGIAKFGQRLRDTSEEKKAARDFGYDVAKGGIKHAQELDKLKLTASGAAKNGKTGNLQTSINAATSILSKAFGSMDPFGNISLGGNKNAFVAAGELASRYVNEGMDSGMAASRAFQEVTGEQLPTSAFQGIGTPQAQGMKTYKGTTPDGKEIEFTDADIEATAEAREMEVKDVKRQLGIE